MDKPVNMDKTDEWMIDDIQMNQWIESRWMDVQLNGFINRIQNKVCKIKTFFYSLFLFICTQHIK